MIECPPIIGVILSNGSVVEMAYVPVLDDRIPPMNLLLETVSAILDWADLKTGDISRTSWTHADCTPRDALQSWSASRE